MRRALRDLQYIAVLGPYLSRYFLSLFGGRRVGALVTSSRHVGIDIQRVQFLFRWYYIVLIMLPFRLF
jgi:hypothetical protein